MRHTFVTRLEKPDAATMARRRERWARVPRPLRWAAYVAAALLLLLILAPIFSMFGAGVFLELAHKAAG